MLDDSHLKDLPSNRPLRTFLLVTTLLGFGSEDPEIHNLMKELTDVLRVLLLAVSEAITQVANSL